LTVAGYYLGEAWSRFSEHASSAFNVITFVDTAGVIGRIGLWYIRRRKRASAKR
jgi:membrane protein DedA with SNARE-associated domain